MAQDKEIKGERYYECDICSFNFRESDTVLKNGIRVCKDCNDEGEWVFPKK